MSVLQFRKKLEQDYAAIAKRFGLHPVVAEILVNRGIYTEQEVKVFLNPSLKDNLPDPAAMKNADLAAEIIFDAIDKNEPITIYSDYDVDGLTSCAQLLLFLKALGAHVDSYVPNRFIDGYGLSDYAIQKIVSGNTKLLITVDCGITNVEQISFAKRHGIRALVLDHHQPGKVLPMADAIVNPAQEGCEFKEQKLAAAGVVWMLLIQLRSRALKNGRIGVPDPKSFLDLAAIGTICDMVPLKGLNRLIAKRGIEAIKKSSRVGIKVLREVAGVASDSVFGCSQISFALGPRINAAGRLGDASNVITLLTTENESVARKIASQIDRLNTERKQIEERVKEACIATINSKGEIPAAFAIFADSFHVGVIGIAAQRLVENFYKPAAVMAYGDQMVRGEIVKVIKGSVRSVPGFHVSQALAKISDVFINHGGHESAGGFSLLPENLEKFRHLFVELAAQTFGDNPPENQTFADVEVDFTQVNIDLVDQLELLAPFGVGNPAPVLVSSNVEVITSSPIGANHLKLRLKQNQSVRDCLAWNQIANPILRKGKILKIAYRPQLNLFNGIANLQLHLKDAWEEEK